MAIRDLTLVSQKANRGRKASFGRGLRTLSAACVILLAGDAVGQELFLDLTKASGTKIPCVGGGLGGASDGPPSLPPVAPLALDILSLNAKSYKEGDEFTSELLLTNKGAQAILIPSSLNPNLVYAEGCKRVPTKLGARALLGDVSLIFEDEHGFWEAIDGAFLYGVSDESTTYLELGPGKTLHMKTAGKVHLYNLIVETHKANLPFNLPLQVGVYATFSLDDLTLKRYRPTTSTNRLQIEIEGK